MKRFLAVLSFLIPVYACAHTHVWIDLGIYHNLQHSNITADISYDANSIIYSNSHPGIAGVPVKAVTPDNSVYYLAFVFDCLTNQYGYSQIHAANTPHPYTGKSYGPYHVKPGTIGNDLYTIICTKT